MAKNLVIYYSRNGENYCNGIIKNIKRGNTEILAEFIQKAVGADLFKVETVKPYAADYYVCTQEAMQELCAGARPELKKYLDNINDYDNIVIAGPCWWGTFPMAIFSALERLDFTDKKVLAVMTHEGSGLGNSIADLQKVCKGAKIEDSGAFVGSQVRNSEDKISLWAKSKL